MSITENGATFAFLSLSDYELLEGAIRANTITFLKGKIEECKLTPADSFVAWREARPDIVLKDQVYTYARHTREGARKALERSLTKGGASAEKVTEIIDLYDIENAGNLAAALLGFENRVPMGRMKSVEANPTSPNGSPSLPS